MGSLTILGWYITTDRKTLGSGAYDRQKAVKALYRTTNTAPDPRTAAVKSLAESTLNPDDDDHEDALALCEACDRGHLCPDSWDGPNVSLNIVPMSSRFNQQIWRHQVEGAIERYARTIHSQTSRIGVSGQQGCYVQVEIALDYDGDVVAPKSYKVTVKAWPREGTTVTANGGTLSTQGKGVDWTITGTARTDAPVIPKQDDSKDAIEEDYLKIIRGYRDRISTLWRDAVEEVKDGKWLLEKQALTEHISFVLPAKPEERPYAALDYLFLNGDLDALIRDIRGTTTTRAPKKDRILHSAGFEKFQVRLVHAANLLRHGSTVLCSDEDGSRLWITNKNLAPQVDHTFPKGTWSPCGLDCFSNATLLPAAKNRGKSSKVEEAMMFAIIGKAKDPERPDRSRGRKLNYSEKTGQKIIHQSLKMQSLELTRETILNRMADAAEKHRKTQREKILAELRGKLYQPYNLKTVTTAGGKTRSIWISMGSHIVAGDIAAITNIENAIVEEEIDSLGFYTSDYEDDDDYEDTIDRLY